MCASLSDWKAFLIVNRPATLSFYPQNGSVKEARLLSQMFVEEV